MTFGVEGTFYSNVVGGRVSNFFKDFTIHEIVDLQDLTNLVSRHTM
jgi:hypothetical protein